MKCNNTHCKYYKPAESFKLFGLKINKKAAANIRTARKRGEKK